MSNTNIEYKTFVLGKATVNEEKREFTAVITDQTLDRDDEVILARGLNVKDFKQNGIILFNHDTSMPIGKALNIKRVGDQWIMTGKLAAAGTVAKADEIWQLVKQGMLKAISIGFMIVERRQPTQEDIKEFGKDVWRVISKSKLLEASIVAVPANQNALIQSMKALNIDPKSLLGDDFKELDDKVIVEPIEEDTVNEDIEKDLIDKVRKQLQRKYDKDIQEKELKELIKKELVQRELYKNGNIYY